MSRSAPAASVSRSTRLPIRPLRTVRPELKGSADWGMGFPLVLVRIGARVATRLPKLMMPRQLLHEKKSAVVEHAIQQTFERRDVVRAEAAQELLLDHVLRLEQLWKEDLAGRREFEVRPAAILGIRHAANEPLLLEAVDHARHRTRVVRDAAAQARRRVGFAVGHRGEHDELRRRDVEARELAVHRVDQFNADAIDQPDNAVLRLRGRRMILGDGTGCAWRAHGNRIYMPRQLLSRPVCERRNCAPRPLTNAHDSQAALRRVPSLLAEDRSAHRQAAQPRDVLYARSGREARARSAVLQASLGGRAHGCACHPAASARPVAPARVAPKLPSASPTASSTSFARPTSSSRISAMLICAPTTCARRTFSPTTFARSTSSRTTCARRTFW